MRLEVFFLDSADDYVTEQVAQLLAKHSLGSAGNGFDGVRVGELLKAVLKEMRSESNDLEGKIVIDGEGRLLSPDCLLSEVEGCPNPTSGSDGDSPGMQAAPQKDGNRVVSPFHLSLRACLCLARAAVPRKTSPSST